MRCRMYFEFLDPGWHMGILRPQFLKEPAKIIAVELCKMHFGVYFELSYSLNS